MISSCTSPGERIPSLQLHAGPNPLCHPRHTQHCLLLTEDPLYSELFLFCSSGTRSQITTSSLHISSIAGDTQLSHFIFFTPNSYGSFGILSRKTRGRRFSPTHHPLVSLVGVSKSWNSGVGKQGENSFYSERAISR